MILKLSDQASLPTGRLILKIYRGNKLIETFDEKNLIVDGSKQIQSRLIGGSFTNNNISQIAFGTNGTAPVGGNTIITGAYTKALDTITYPATNQTSFNFSLGGSEANPKAILEFGLITAGGALYARKVRALALNKDSDISLSGSWVITF